MTSATSPTAAQRCATCCLIWPSSAGAAAPTTNTSRPSPKPCSAVRSRSADEVAAQSSEPVQWMGPGAPGPVGCGLGARARAARLRVGSATDRGHRCRSGHRRTEHPPCEETGLLPTSDRAGVSPGTDGARVTFRQCRARSREPVDGRWRWRPVRPRVRCPPGGRGSGRRTVTNSSSRQRCRDLSAIRVDRDARPAPHGARPGSLPLR